MFKNKTGNNNETGCDVSGTKNDYHKSVIKSRAIACIIIGGLIIVIIFIVKLIDDSNWNEKWKLVRDTICDLLNIVVSLIIGLGVGSFVLDFFSYISYAQDRIREVIIGKDYTNTLKNETKKELIEQLQSSLYFDNNPIPENSLYKNIHENIIPLLDKPYLEEYTLHIDCVIEEKIIKKTFHHKMKVFSHSNEVPYQIPFSIYLDAIPNIGKDEAYKIDKMIFNGKETKVELVSDEINSEYDKKRYKYTATTEFTLHKGINTIDYESRSIVGIDENTYSHRLSAPCRKYSTSLSIIGNSEYNIKAYGFTIDAENTCSVNYYKNMCELQFDNWSLPGDGCVFFVKKNF